MEIQQSFFEYIRGQHDSNNSVIEVVGARVCFYKFNFVVGNNSKDKAYKGGLFYEIDGEITHVKFVKVVNEETARSAFKHSSRISNEGILRPWFYVFCKQKCFKSLPCNEELLKGVWTICYDHYEESLYDWVRRVVRDTSSSYTESSKLPIKNARDCLHPYWIETIRQLVNTVTRIHDKGFFHGSLTKRENYVMSEKCLKIINFGGSLEGKNQSDQDKLKRDDFIDIKVMLEYLFESLLAPKTPSSKKKATKFDLSKEWIEADRFLKFFDYINIWKYEKFVSKLLGHPFFKSPEERLEWIDTVNNDRKDPTLSLKVRSVLGKADFAVFSSWKSGGFKEAFMKEVFEYNPSSYNNDAVSLLRYLRNLNQHFRDVKTCNRPTVEEADHAIRKCFDNFLEVAGSVAFLIARYFARARIRKVVEGNKKSLAMDKAIGENRFGVVTLLRWSPLLPFSLGNYLYRFTYVLGSWLGMLPGTWAYVSAGAFGRAIIEMGSVPDTSLSVRDVEEVDGICSLLISCCGPPA
ncbi:hypothetical protein ACE6H2_025985 [Prunus campanulata]